MSDSKVPRPLHPNGPVGQGLCLVGSKEVRRTVPSRIERITRAIDCGHAEKAGK